MTVPPLLRLEHLCKSFGAVRAVDDVSLEVSAGEVMALAGDNGAGKSVLIKCVAGIYTPDSGRIWWEGRQVRLRSPGDASGIGIATVYQDLALCDNLDVVQNLFLGRERRARVVLDEADMELESRRILRELAVSTLASPRQKVGALSGGQRQAVAIARAVLWQSKLLIMDEPTAALGVAQTKVVLDLITRLAERGLAVIVISHNLNDVDQVADTVAVLHMGRLVCARPVSEIGRSALVRLMATGNLGEPALVREDRGYAGSAGSLVS